MKIVVTGSLGHISKPLTEELVQKGHAVTVISSSTERRKEIEVLGATAAIGSVEDVTFLTDSFTGADAVYIMIPPNNYFDHSLDLYAYYPRLGSNYTRAIQQSGVKRVVNLSTIGADLEQGSGILIGAHRVEAILNGLPKDVAITHMRPTSFNYNLFGYADMIKEHNCIYTNYGDELIPWVSPKDIAAAVAEELTTTLIGRKVRYIASEELTGNQTAKVLGEALGKPDLKWVVVPDEQVAEALKGAGMNPTIADGLVEMYASLNNGVLAADYHRNKPAVLGKTKMADFAKEFAATIQ